jgi:hypothetical protein
MSKRSTAWLWFHHPSTPRSGVYYFSQGWKLIGLPGIRLRHSAAVGQHYSDGRRVLVAVHKAGKLDPF